MSAWTGWYWLLGAEPEGRPGHVVGSDLITSAHEFDLPCSRFQTLTGCSDRSQNRLTSRQPKTRNLSRVAANHGLDKLILARRDSSNDQVQGDSKVHNRASLRPLPILDSPGRWPGVTDPVPAGHNPSRASRRRHWPASPRVRAAAGPTASAGVWPRQAVQGGVLAQPGGSVWAKEPAADLVTHLRAHWAVHHASRPAAPLPAGNHPGMVSTQEALPTVRPKHSG